MARFGVRPFRGVREACHIGLGRGLGQRRALDTGEKLAAQAQRCNLRRVQRIAVVNILFKPDIQARLGMGQKLFARKVGRDLFQGLTNRAAGLADVGRAKQVDLDGRGQVRGRAIDVQFHEIDGQIVVNALPDLDFLVVAIGVVDRALNLGGQLGGVVAARADIDRHRLVAVVDVHKQKVPAPKGVPRGV